MAGEAPMTRLNDLQRFYSIMDQLASTRGRAMPLAAVAATTVALRGVYFFFEPGEARSDSGAGPRVVRVGTHGLKAGAVSTLHGRLRQHRGKRDGGGNHRGSIFRLLTGDALMRCGAVGQCSSWGSSGETGRSSNRSQPLKQVEAALEQAVSARLAAMQLVCLDVGDPAGPESQRGWIERNAISLLSNNDKPPLDPPSADWLGHHSSRPRVRLSGLWNQNHVDEPYDRSFLDDLERLASGR